MTYPVLQEQPFKVGAGLHYPATEDLRSLFTKKDRYGEEYQMYQYDIADNAIIVPRNCTPPVEFDKIGSMAATGIDLATGIDYEWANGFVPKDDEQERLVSESVELLCSSYYNGHIMQAPTGYGKTYLGSAVIQRLGVKTLVITTKEDILQDWKTALSKTLRIHEDKIGEWRADIVPEDHHEVVVGLIQSVCKGYDRYPRSVYESFGFVVVDEVQRMGAEKFGDAMWFLPARHRLGLSATPTRKDGRDALFHAHIGHIEVRTEEMKLVPKVICVDTDWEVPKVWNYQTGEVGPLIIPWDRTIIAVKHLASDFHRNQIMVNFLHAALKKNRLTVVLSDTVDHLQAIKDACIESGIEDKDNMFGWYVGLQNSVYKEQVPRKDRYQDYKKDLREKATLAKICFATYKMCSEGTNVPWWDTEILATPKADVEQPVGRILREWEGKHLPVVLDMCDYNHKVTATFANKRQDWYESIGAEIVHK